MVVIDEREARRTTLKLLCDAIHSTQVFSCILHSPALSLYVDAYSASWMIFYK